MSHPFTVSGDRRGRGRCIAGGHAVDGIVAERTFRSGARCAPAPARAPMAGC
ncbi:hypothetical protein H0E84_19225 [Luteimonas sp. SJ-92]|uniref:Uncharacterized protein n=1 Tax=Luteimonas salinisoli TaxID=2752307 RepID=A0A853JJF3_9GAMM|nr:hypothetical protein [Luteimonas salinisoli]NZA28510.1 hypothetical protein [Luteimonas salinisoli]